MYFESKKAGGVKAEAVKNDSKKTATRLTAYGKKFSEAKAKKTKGGNS